MWLFLCRMFALYQFILPSAHPTQLQFKHGQTCTQTHAHSHFVRHMLLFQCCLTSTEARWPVRDGLSSHVCPLSVYTSLCPPHPAPVQTHMHTHTLTHAHIHTHMRACTHACTHMHTRMLTHTHAGTHADTLSHSLWSLCAKDEQVNIFCVEMELYSCPSHLMSSLPSFTPVHGQMWHLCAFSHKHVKASWKQIDINSNEIV